jgi:hypothetical protein
VFYSSKIVPEVLDSQSTNPEDGSRKFLKNDGNY